MKFIPKKLPQIQNNYVMITELLLSPRTAARNTIIVVFNTKNTLKQLWILGRLYLKIQASLHCRGKRGQQCYKHTSLIERVLAWQYSKKKKEIRKKQQNFMTRYKIKKFVLFHILQGQVTTE